MRLKPRQARAIVLLAAWLLCAIAVHAQEASPAAVVLDAHLMHTLGGISVDVLFVLGQLLCIGMLAYGAWTCLVHTGRYDVESLRCEVLASRARKFATPSSPPRGAVGGIGELPTPPRTRPFASPAVAAPVDS
jgi:hypothetical protein